MKKHLLVAAALLPALSQAAPVATPPGPLMTLGPASTPQTGLSVLYNPAAGEAVIQPNDDYRWGYLGSTGVSVEFGDVENFADDVDQLVDDLDRDNLGILEAEIIIANYDNNLRHTLAADGYIRFDAQFVAPLAPLLVRSNLLGGVMSIDLVGGVSGKGLFLDDKITAVGTVDGISVDNLTLADLANINPGSVASVDLETETALFIKSVQYTTLGLGYSHELDNGLLDTLNQHVEGRLLTGLRLNLYNLKLAQQVIGLANIEEDDDVSDVISDDYDDNQASSSAMGIDLGLIWEADHYQVGLTFRNINEPEFDFSEIGTNCLSKSTAIAVANCNTANFHINNLENPGRVIQNDTYVMTQQSTVDLALSSENKRWRLAASYDLQSTEDAIGDEYQWMTASAAYVSSSLFGARLGFSENQVGSELTMANAGLTFFGVVNLDVRYSLDSTEVDGSTVPRSVAVNLGIESSF